MQSAYIPQQASSSSGDRPNYRLRTFLIFFIWFACLALVPFINTGSAQGSLFDFKQVKQFFDSKPHFIAVVGWILQFAVPALIAVFLLVFGFAAGERTLGVWLFLIGVGHWFLFALGPVISIIFKKSPALFYGPLSQSTGAAAWKATIPFWFGMVAVAMLFAGAFSIFTRRHNTRRGVLTALIATVVLVALYFVPMLPMAGKYSSLWTRIIESRVSLVLLVLCLVPLVIALLCLLSLTGMRRKGLLTGISGGLLFVYFFLPFWTVKLVNLQGVNWADVSAKFFPRVLLNQVIGIVQAVRSFDWGIFGAQGGMPGFILPSILLAGMGVFLFGVGKPKPRGVYLPAPTPVPPPVPAPAPQPDYTPENNSDSTENSENPGT